MKTTSHFMTGIAIASCFPPAVHAAASGDPVCFVVAGICGLLPDTLDFRFARHVCRSDVHIVPDPHTPDPQMIADGLALAFNRAYEVDRPVRVKLHTVPLGADTWQRYDVRFNVAKKRVEVSYGPIVNSAARAVGAHAIRETLAANAPLICRPRIDYEAVTRVTTFDGPTFAMTATPGQTVTPVFLPWHRTWSHSLVLAVLAGLLGAVVFDLTAGWIMGLAYAAHILADQFGYMGSNLFYPFSRERTPGLKMMHAAAAVPNALTVWVCCLLIFWNLRPDSVPLAGPVAYAVYGLLIPASLLWLGRRIFRKNS